MTSRSLLPVLLLTCPFLAAPPPVAAQVSVPPAGGGLKGAAVEAGYRGILAEVARGQGEVALDRLAELETAALSEVPEPQEVERLWKAKLAVIRDVIADGVEPLVPIMLLHHDASSRYRAAGRRTLARHSIDMTAELTNFYVDRSGNPGARRLAAAVLAGLGGHLQESWSLSSAATLFARVLELEPGHQAAHLALATMYEKRGEYREAIEHLSIAHDQEPESCEVRLRLALCRLRRGEAVAGRSVLEKVARDPGAEPWVAVLAYQELGRLRFEQGDVAAAEEILMEARERFPDNQRLALQVAFLRDEQGLSAPSLGELDDVDAVDETAAAETPRYTYTRWPQRWLEASRRSLDGVGEERLGTLSAALGLVEEESEVAS